MGLCRGAGFCVVMRKFPWRAWCAASLLGWIASLPSFGQTPPLLKLLTHSQLDVAVDSSLKSPHHYLNELIHRSETLQLQRDPVWLSLILYQSKWFNRVKSQVADPHFFMSDLGKKDPGAELAATLASFFSDILVPPTRVTSQCRFPARFYWLNLKLQFDPARIKIQSCPNLDHFYEFIKPVSLTLVFPSTHPNSPSSMFGHTLLRFNRPDVPVDARMLNMTITYNAIVPPDINPLQYVLLGLTNNFAGQFSLLPYYLKLREYSQMESRDLWEYQLRLQPEQIRWIMMHAFELSIAFFNYKFFSENCSYHLLSLLDVAFPQEKFTTQFKNWTIPIETIKYLEKRGLIEDVVYYPSLTRKIMEKSRQLPKEHYRLAVSAYKKGLTRVKDAILMLPEKNQAPIWDLLSELYRYRKLKEAEHSHPQLTEIEREVLLLRSKITENVPETVVSPPSIRPDKGHDITRISAGFERSASHNYYDVEWRPSYHDLLDPSDGFVANSSLEYFKTRLRIDEEQRQLRLYQLTLLDIQSLEPRNKLFKNKSWRFKLGWQQFPLDGHSWGSYTALEAGMGLTWQLGALPRNIYYGFFNAALRQGRVLDKDFSVMPGLTAGLLLEPWQNWRLQIQAAYNKGVVGDAHAEEHYEVKQNIAMGSQWSLGVYWQRTRYLWDFRNSSGFNIYYYF